MHVIVLAVSCHRDGHPSQGVSDNHLKREWSTSSCMLYIGPAELEKQEQNVLRRKELHEFSLGPLRTLACMHAHGCAVNSNNGVPCMRRSLIGEDAPDSRQRLMNLTSRNIARILTIKQVITWV